MTFDRRRSELEARSLRRLDLPRGHHDQFAELDAHNFVTTIMSPSPPSPTGESGRGEVARIKSPRPDPLPALRGEGNVFRTVIVPPEEVREKFKRVKPLKEISVKQRGWTLDVLNAIRRLGKSEFTTADAYAFARDLEKLHPDNPVNYAVTRGRPARQG